MIGKAFLQYSGRSRQGWFGSRVLGLMLTEDGGSVRIDKKHPNLFECQLPRWSLRSDGRLPLATIVAVMDDASTYSIAMEDKKGRFGVSVELSGAVCKDAPKLSASDTDLIFDTRIRKIGHTLAFAECFVYLKSTGDLLARCEHLKYLPSGFIMDNAKRLFDNVPILYRCLNKFAAQNKAKPLIQALPDIDQNQFIVTRDLCNPVGGMHGGGTCIIGERSASNTLPPHAWPCALKSTYLSALRPGQLASFHVKKTHHDDLGLDRIGRSVALVASHTNLSTLPAATPPTAAAAVELDITYELAS